MTNVTTLKTYFQSGVGVAADDISVGDGAVTLSTSSGNITIDATANDTDIIFKGTDNSSDITMLTLDGSDAGSATFNHDIILGNDSFVRFGDAGEKITGDGTDLTINSSNDLHLTATTDINIPADVGLTFGDDGEKIEGDGTDLTISSSALATIDAGTDITLDADGGDIFFKDGGTTFGSATNTSGNLIIKSGTTTALTFSGANATFAGTLATAAGGFNIAGLDIDGATDIGEAVVDADLFIVDNGAGGTNRKVAASRLVTYIDANSSAASVGKAIAMAIVFG